MQTFKSSLISPRLQIHLGILETPTPPRTPQLSEWGSVGVDHYASFTQVHKTTHVFHFVSMSAGVSIILIVCCKVASDAKVVGSASEAPANASR